MDSVRGFVILNLVPNLDQDLSNDGSRFLVQGARGLKPCPMGGILYPVRKPRCLQRERKLFLFRRTRGLTLCVTLLVRK